MTTAWAHLPNAVHIDRVMEHAKAHPDKWDSAQDAALDVAWDAALDAARYSARYAARDAAIDVAWDAARDAIFALVVWDEAGDLFSQPIEVAKFLADEGNPAAVMLYPAMLVMEKTVDTVNDQE